MSPLAFAMNPRAILSLRVPSLLALAVASALPLTAQGTIAFSANPIPQTNAPAGVAGHAIAARADGTMVMFGGVQAGGLLPATFTSQNNVWAPRVSVLNPALRSEAALAFDGVRNDTLLFGGVDQVGNPLGDTWTFGNDQWNYRPLTASPSARRGHAMAFDAQRGVVLLFGGAGASQSLLGDTWTWNGVAWQQQAPTNSPSARTEHGMAFDAFRQRIVLFGGESQSGLRNDVHEWDGSNWVAVTLAVNNGVSWAPSPRSQHAIGYDPVAERVVVHAGQLQGGVLAVDTWSWDGTNWAQLLVNGTAPSYRKNAAMGRDPQSQRLMPIGGENGGQQFFDATALEVPVMSRLSEYGAACVGSAGALQLRPVANAQAALGTTLQMQMTGLALPFSAGVGFVGLSDQQVNGIPLPVDLGLVGIPGCNAYNSADIQFPLGVPSGSPLVTQWGLAIPNDGVFLGLEIYLQALALEGFGFSRFATVTNGIAARIGNAVSVTAVPPPVASFTATPTVGALPLVVQFTDTSTGDVGAWQWDFDNDGVVDSTLQNPTHTYTTGGQYSVRLVAVNYGGTSAVLRSNLIYAGVAPNPGLNMVAIQPGTFQMGSAVGYRNEQPVHAVTITMPFWIGAHEVTQAQFQAVMGSNPSYWLGSQRPVEQVSWYSAMAYCAALTATEAGAGRIPAGYQYRLPTEAEWEYCCRAGTTSEWSTGWSIGASQANINYSVGQTIGVGNYAPNPWGIFDMHGNVLEWCLDSWDGSENYPLSAVSDPYVSSGPVRVARGGSWSLTADSCRSSSRVSRNPGLTINNVVGFRVILGPILVP
jgi:formylglycine-generating enzyme required for sulfatase activity